MFFSFLSQQKSISRRDSASLGASILPSHLYRRWGGQGGWEGSTPQSRGKFHSFKGEVSL